MGDLDGPLGVVGLGAMGAGIARACAVAGLETRIFDAAPGRAAAAREAIGAALKRRGDPGADQVIARLEPVRTLADLSDCQVVVEAVYEDFEVKAAVLGDLVAILAAGIVASNTSSLSITALAARTGRPERVVGAHFFVPAHANPLVEVVRGAATSEPTVQAALGLCRALGKAPLVCADTPGFVANRFYLPLCNEAMRIVEDGLATASQVDAAARAAFGLELGPFGVCRLGKLATTLASIAGLAPLGALYTPCEALRVRAREEAQWPQEDLPSDFAPDERVVERLWGAVFLSVLDALDEGVAPASAFDMAARVGLRFSRPPCGLMDDLGQRAVAAAVAPLCARYAMSAPTSLTRVGGLLSAPEAVGQP